MRVKRLRPKVIVRRITSSKSSRLGAAIQLIVLHTTEGVMELRDRAVWWDGQEASAHVGVKDGKSARYVPDDEKAWTQKFYNPMALAIEIEGFSAWLHWRRKRGDDVREVARWIAHWSLTYDIPIRLGIVLGGRVLRTGVVGHRRLGLLGGGHHDPGNFPVLYCMRLARQIKQDRLERRQKGKR